ncbi:trypsin-like serine peptidase [Fodinibius halophilus]|uniref:Trypsin-like peptidase domain-containing protein n=1 Tax=Fodinibius halophilus TaxID=1736908 RepID=A0A6M1T1I8_9BACT|nr:serine protease [Fodinibius halophilus]NGP89938.1 trypsin-like peptidase domain-containing protein [Fodinibius halophilus]
MFIKILRPLSVIWVSLFLSSCASIPITLDKPQKMFPADLPSNVCYLKTVRAVRIIGFRTGYNSTGTLIEGQYLVTAAHNLYDSWRTRLLGVQVTCKADDGSIVTSIVSKEGISKTRKVSHYNKEYATDYAFLKLNKPIPVTEILTLTRDTNIENVQEIEVAGYPSIKLEHLTGKVKHPIPNDSTFYYEVDTKKGMSGGPVWPTSQSTGTVPLLGIHVTEGRARIVNSDLIDDFENWKDSLK